MLFMQKGPEVGGPSHPHIEIPETLRVQTRSFVSAAASPLIDIQLLPAISFNVAGLTSQTEKARRLSTAETNSVRAAALHKKACVAF